VACEASLCAFLARRAKAAGDGAHSPWESSARLAVRALPVLRLTHVGSPWSRKFTTTSDELVHVIVGTFVNRWNQVATHIPRDNQQPEMDIGAVMKEAVSLRLLERFVVPGQEKLNVWLALSSPLSPALVAGQRHRVRAARGHDGLRSAMVIATDWAGAIELSHRQKVNCKPSDE